MLSAVLLIFINQHPLYWFVFFEKYQCVPLLTPERYNGVGGELTVMKLDLSYIGPQLKQARLSANLTQEDVAEQLGVTARYVMAIENEGKCPSLDVCFRLIRILNISADAIVYPEKRISEGGDERLIRMIQMLNSRDKKIVYATAQKMLDVE